MFEQRLSSAQRQIARQVFLRLTEPRDGTDDTRRRATLEELIGWPEEALAVETVIKVLADERLLTADEQSIEVAHEALITHWPRLRRWLDEDRVGLGIHRRLTEAAEEWERLGRDDGAVFPVDPWLDPVGRLRRATLHIGPQRTSLELADYGQADGIDLPDASEIVRE